MYLKLDGFTRLLAKPRYWIKLYAKLSKRWLKERLDDLGGGIYKKRLNQNRHRSIILAKGKDYWVYEFLYAKKDLANISDPELENFRLLAKAYAGLNEQQIDNLLKNKMLVEICYETNK